MEVLRTPEARFQNLKDFSFAPNYVEVPRGDATGNLRMHYLDEGDPNSTETVLMMHGEPSWCYLYRKMIPSVVAAGHRVIAPDLPGFGRSDKPGQREDYTYQRHVDWVTAFLVSLDLTGITLVCQDWGGLIGLRIATEHPDRFTRIVAANTFMPTGDHQASDAFLAWRKYSQEVENFKVGNIVNGGCATDLSDDEIAAYDAPFPDDTYKSGARQFPTLVPTTPDDPASEANRAAWVVLGNWTKPFLTAFSDNDPVTAGNDDNLRKRIPGAQGQAHATMKGGRHFLQEDCGPELSQVVIDFIAANK